jgi:excisionase family DNA binding protein
MDDQRPEIKGFWTAQELAAAAKVSDAYIRQLLLAHKLEAVKAGPVWVIPYAEGQRWLEQRAAKRQG